MTTLAAERTDQTTDLYPSRRGLQAELTDRKDPVVWGNEAGGPLRQEHLRRYEQDGFLLFDSMFNDDDLVDYRSELDRLRTDPSQRDREDAIIEPGSRAPRSLFAIHENNEILSRLCRDPRLVAIARQLLGGDLYVHQSRVNYKSGFTGKEFYWHSDFETWHVEDGMPRMRAVSCSISLTRNDPNAGPLLLIPGSHRQFLSCVGETPEDNYKSSLKKQEIGVPDDQSLEAMVEAGGIQAAVGPAGSVVFFECNTMHGSNSNITPFPRSNCFVVYNSVENALVEPFCGLAPRPEFIANRHDFSPLTTS